MRALHFEILLFFVLLLLNSCFSSPTKQGKQSSVVEAQSVVHALFNADSAYQYVEAQVAFGPRVPNTEAHVACGDYLVSKLKQFGAEVIEQKADLKAYDGTLLKSRNIIGVYHPEKEERILLFAHWDTRPFADEDENEAHYHTPIDGANDGASGVGVLLEMARLIQSRDIDRGIDIIFFDSEDYGIPSFVDEVKEDTWCLGSQYWAKNPHKPDYKASYGILLDMVGGFNATFRKERASVYFASNIVEKVWSKAIQLGYGKNFIQSKGTAITDDHIYVNQIAKIPSIDIIDYDPARKNGFPDTWHTLQDNMQNISKETLEVVGKTITEIIYSK